MRFFNLFTPARTEIVNKKPAKTTYYSRSAENGTDKVLSRGEENSSVHMTYVNFLKPRKSALDVTLYAASSGRSFFHRVLQIRRDFLTTCTQKSTRGKKSQVDTALCGRSMVEMLGVLAIIGVLSIGAISGYSKAMFKYKSNKQTEQTNTIISALWRYQTDFHLAPHTDTFQEVLLVPILKKLGEIPTEMYIKDRPMYIKDALGTECYAYYRTNKGMERITYRCNLKRTENGFEICRNLYTIAKAWHQEIDSVVTIAYQGETYDENERYYGDSYCSGKNKCLKDITFNDIEQACQTEKNDDHYSIAIHIVTAY